MADDLVSLRLEVEQEARQNILPFWLNKVWAPDGLTFVGEIGHDGTADHLAAKSGILAARMLWTFSHAFLLYGDRKFRQAADNAYHYLITHFWDAQFGGTYWSVNAGDFPLDVKKHIYANSFSMYSLVEYFRASGERQALDKAIEVFRLVEQHAHDPVHRGWHESFERDWSNSEDARLAVGEHNAPKSMNTHLHLMEAMTNLLRVWQAPLLIERQREMLRVFLDHIIHSARNQFVLFFSDTWQPQLDVVSFGHDIEGSWLIMEAAEVLGDEALIHETRERGLKMAQVVLEQGVDRDGAVLGEDESGEGFEVIKDWWPQAEAVVGFLNAYEASGDDKFLTASMDAWTWIKTYLIDREHGEWYWGTTRDRAPLQRELAGFWKCPYHNGRMCFEVQERVEKRHERS